jgi:hypothetical protein
MTCSRCQNTDPNCYVCQSEETEPEAFSANPYEDHLDQLLNENPETE